ncbi:MAG: 6-phosphofructokinase [Chitinophagales bacterium]|nr:6-phosphofructokinase [Chitinophagales bacterium]
MSKKTIAVMTSGGDVSGLNAAIRAIVRTAIYYNRTVIGVEKGYDGLIDADFRSLNSGSVSHIISRGGTLLQSSRSERFREKKYRDIAYQNLKDHDIKYIILIGGDGSLKGASIMSQESDINVVGIPKTIDNDISGTDFAIGFDTAVNVAMEAIDRIRDTAMSHNRLFFIEVMGRNAGYIALEAGIAVGAEGIIIPETNRDLELLYKTIDHKKDWKNSSFIVIVAEGDETGGAYKLQKLIHERYPELYTGVTILGHIQRGGSPTCADRTLATRLGVAAVEKLLQGEKNVMIGKVHDEIVCTPLDKIHNRRLDVDNEMLKLLKILSK